MLLVALLVSMALTGVGSSTPTVVMYVDPQWNAGAPGQIFDINVMVKDVVNLYLTELYVSFDPVVLEALDATLGDFEMFYIKEIDNDAGIVHLVAGRPVGVKEGLNGTLVLATIEFMVETDGGCVLDLYDTDPVDIDGVHLTHATADGYFNIYPTLWIRKHGARIYPESHGVAVGQPQTIYAKIVNIGTLGAYVKVNLTLDGPTEPIGLWTNESWVEPGGKTTVTAEFTPEIPGVYYVKGILYFSADGLEWTSYSDVQGMFGGEGVSRDPTTRFRAS